MFCGMNAPRLYPQNSRFWAHGGRWVAINESYYYWNWKLLLIGIKHAWEQDLSLMSCRMDAFEMRGLGGFFFYFLKKDVRVEAMVAVEKVTADRFVSKKLRAMMVAANEVGREGGE